MNQTSADQRGTISQFGNIMRVENALVEDVFTSSRRTGYVMISYAVPGSDQMIYIELLRLNVVRNTAITNQFGVPLCFCDIKKGMWVDAQFSAAMTRSIPPQSTAYWIVVHEEQEPVNVTTDRVTSVDISNRFLYTGNPNDINDQMRFIVSNSTVIFDQSGNIIPLSAIQPGQMVRVEHANFQTASIPPQTTAFRIQLL